MIVNQNMMKMSDKTESLALAAVGVALAFWVIGRLLAI